MMEPMNLGSPIGSPNNVVSSPTQPNSPYLPSFLMGEASANVCLLIIIYFFNLKYV